MVACGGSGWRSNLRANPIQVARVLGDSVALGPEEAFHPDSVPHIDPPKHVRPCCAFGMDLQIGVGAAHLPFVEKPNIISVPELAHHGYDDGELLRDHNGLIYTCRGGFIDTAHVRDNADRTLYLAMQIVRALPGPMTLELPDEGTKRRVRMQAMEEALCGPLSRWNTAILLAEWINYELSIWHEIITWYGWESVPGFSERLSAFSLEDLYSNVLGQLITAGIVQNRELRSRGEYDQAVDAWMREALRRLGAVSREEGRAAMKAVDGRWWNSQRKLSDFKLVLRRNLDIASPQSPWLVPANRSAVCARSPRSQPPLLLKIPERIDGKPIHTLVSIEFEFHGWIPERFPLPVQAGTILTPADFPTILSDIRRMGEAELGKGFDHP